MENKTNNVLIYIVMFIFGAALALGFCYFKNSQANKETPKEEKTVCEPCPETKCENEEAIANEKGYMQVYYDYSPSLSYNMYGYYNHQGVEYKIIEYNGELYSVFGNNANTCVEKLLEGSAKFSNNEFVCEYEEEIEISIKKLNIKSADVSKVKILNNCRTDGAPTVFIIGTNGEVKAFTAIDKQTITDSFKGYKVKDITGFSCKAINQDSAKPVYTLLLEDGTTITE